MDKNFFQKIVIIDQLIGAEAPLASKLRAFIGMHDPRPANIELARNLAMQAIQLDAFGFGWNTVMQQHAEGEGSPYLEITVGEVIDRYDLTYWLMDTEDNGRLHSNDWKDLMGSNK